MRIAKMLILGIWATLMVGCQESSDPLAAAPTTPGADEPEAARLQSTSTRRPPTQQVPTELPTKSGPPRFPTATFPEEKYKPDGGTRNALDVYLPVEGEGPFPTILAFHGGGFLARSKSLYMPLARHFTDQGYALVAANYRYATAEAPYPAQVEDAFCALAWVHSYAAEFGFDSDHIFVMGDSAGGHLAAMLATVETPDLYRGDCPHVVPESHPIRGTVVFYGFFDDQMSERSPLSWIDGSEPPFLLLHGTQDRSIASVASENFAAALGVAGVEATLVLLEDQHAFIVQPVSSPTMTDALGAIDAFLGELSGS